MKTLLFLLLTFFVFQARTQTGGTYLKCLTESKKNAIQGLNIQIWNDSLCINGVTDINGSVLLRGIPVGETELWIQNSDKTKTLHSTIFIQENQLVQISFLIDSSFTTIDASLKGDQFDIDPNGISKETGNENDLVIDYGSLPIREIQCVTISAYSTNLKYNSGVSGATVTREDISRLPTRSVNGIASTVGGVNAVEGENSLHIRGGRADANAYYLDGVRICNANAIPKSAIQNTSVYTGGVPANFGDATGGVISVESKSYNSRSAYQPTYISVHKRKEPNLEGLNYDHFLPIYENDFLSPVDHPHSTFGIDVDRASWDFVKRQYRSNNIINRDAVKLEEMINSFKYRNLEVPENELIHLQLERNYCAWNPEHELVTIHLKAKDLPKDLPRKAHNFVFLVDVSGSMNYDDKLPLLVEGLKEFVNTLRPDDRVAIVTYAGSSGVVLQPTTCENKTKILHALGSLTSGGSTNGIGGIQEAYRLAEKNYDPHLNNRIILATDGDFNVGINSTGDLENYISQQRGKGIYLTALGFGMGNYKNSILETLADKGDGNHFYINSLADAKRVLVNEIGNLMNIARDVKLNVEFNPNLVASYRLIGYENRLMKPKDFADDTKDGGEMGYGHVVTAVYEIERGKAVQTETHFVESSGESNPEELAFVKLRYKSFEDSASIEKRFSLNNNETVIDNQLLNLVIAFGLNLRDSAFKGSMTVKQLTVLAKTYIPKTEDEIELKKMILSMEKR